MALVLGEGQLATPAELVLGARRLPIDCQITVEWLRGIEEPTWYGYFTPRCELRMLPGTYQLAVQGVEFRILLRRHPRTGIPNAVPFWGLGEPPAVPRVAADGRTPAVEAGAASRAFEA
jgi:hypothetical protein